MAEPLNPTLKYRIITCALLPAAVIHSIYIALKHKRLNYFLNRVGRYQSTVNLSQPIWCHCASVGEINTALPLLKALIQQGQQLIITTNTVTGYDTLKRAQLQNSSYAYIPLDYTFLAQRYISHFQPKHCLIFETELWPAILLNTIKNNINVIIVNGRISEKTMHAPCFVLKNYRRILSNTKKIISSSEQNSARFISLGADEQCISTLDNLKFAQLNSLQTAEHPKPLEFAYLLCASTHEGEELPILEEWSKRSSHLFGLVIALRHPQRINQVIRILEHLQLDYCLHSTGKTQTDKSTIYIIDTLGELQPFIAHANIVFMGGSLVPIGGHNVIEPAAYSRCILIGPHYDNFKSIVEDLLKQQAIDVVANATELFDKAFEYQINTSKCINKGENAFKYITSKQQILDSFLQQLVQFIQAKD